MATTTPTSRTYTFRDGATVPIVGPIVVPAHLDLCTHCRQPSDSHPCEGWDETCEDEPYGAGFPYGRD